MHWISKTLSRRKKLIQLSLPVLLIIILYAPCLQGYFFDEDFQAIEGNRKLLDSPKDFLRTFTEPGAYGYWEYPDLEPSYRPIYRIHLAVIYKVAGLRPTFYHIANVSIFIVVAILVYIFALKLTRQDKIACLASLFFASHYIFTNSVAWIGGIARMYGLMFSLIAMLSYIEWRQENSKSIFYYVLSVAAFLLALLSVEEAVMLIGVVVIYEFFFQPRDIRKPIRWLAWIPFLVTIIFYMLVRRATGTMLPSYGGTSREYNLDFDIFSNMTYYFVYLFVDIYRFLPYLEGLKSDIVVLLESSSAFKWSVLGVTGAGFLMVGILILRRVRGTVGFLLFWIVLYLAPFLILHHPSSAYLAAPSVGVSILLSIGLCGLLDYSRKKGRWWLSGISYALILTFLVGNFISTFRRNILISEKGDTAKYIISYIKSRHPMFEDGAKLYFANEIDPKTYSFIGLYGVRVLGDNGSEFRLIYENPSLRTSFVNYDYLRQLASEWQFSDKKFFFVYRVDGSLEEIKLGG